MGDDPNTTGQSDETQTIFCSAEGGTFKLSFRGETTISIAYNAAAATIESALEALYTYETELSCCSRG